MTSAEYADYEQRIAEQDAEFRAARERLVRAAAKIVSEGRVSDTLRRVYTQAARKTKESVASVLKRRNGTNGCGNGGGDTIRQVALDYGLSETQEIRLRALLDDE